MSDSEPQRDVKRPDEKPPELVFKPDVRQAVRVARVRMYTVIAAVVLMLVALYLIMSYRPPAVAQSVPAAPAAAVPSTENVGSATVPASGQPAEVPHKASAVEIAGLAAATIDTLMSRAAEKWLRATELSPQGIVTRENAEDAAAKLRKAVILADSARQDIALARQQAEVVLRVSREAESGAAFRLSVLYAAVDRYVKSMADDAGDRYAHYLKSEVSVRAVLLGDQAEYETQQNVAMSYLRRSEERQRSIQRLAQQVREALRNVERTDR